MPVMVSEPLRLQYPPASPIPTGITPASGWELDGLFLRTAPRLTFDETRALSGDYTTGGWSVLDTASSIKTGYEGTAAQGGATTFRWVQADGTTTSWSTGGATTPGWRHKTVNLTPGHTHTLIGHVSAVGTGRAGIFIARSGAVQEAHTISALDGGAQAMFRSIYNSSTKVDITPNPASEALGLRLDFTSDACSAYYYAGALDLTPTWIPVGTVASAIALQTGGVTTLAYGMWVASNAAVSGDQNYDFDHLDDLGMAPVGLWPSFGTRWGATRLPTSATAQDDLYYDYGFTNRRPTDAQLRTWLASCSNLLDGDSATLTFRLTWGAGAHAGHAGAFASAAAVSSSGSGKSLLVEVAYTSDGATVGSFYLGLPPPIAA